MENQSDTLAQHVRTYAVLLIMTCTTQSGLWCLVCARFVHLWSIGTTDTPQTGVRHLGQYCSHYPPPPRPEPWAASSRRGFTRPYAALRGPAFRMYHPQTFPGGTVFTNKNGALLYVHRHVQVWCRDSLGCARHDRSRCRRETNPGEGREDNSRFSSNMVFKTTEFSVFKSERTEYIWIVYK